MPAPIFRRNWFVKLCKNVSNLFNNPLYKFVAKPLIFIIPTSFVLFIITKKEYFKSAIEFLPVQLQTLLTDSQFLVVLAIFTLIQIGKSIEGLIVEWGTPDSELNRDDLVAILTSINEVVKGKMTRFLSATKSAIRGKWAADKVFEEITQPVQQIMLQTKAIHGFFEYFGKNEISFRVGLIQIENKKPVKWVAFFPEEHPPKALLETLSAPTSAIMRSIEKASMIIVADTKKELEKKKKEDRCFVKGMSDTNANSSILTYPIYCPNTKEPIYVLSILAKQKDFLVEKHRDLYDWILDNFLTRVLIEHHLQIMKQGALNE